MTPPSIVIVGAGPAGMSAAITLAEHGLPSTVIDDNAESGGQIYRQPPVPMQWVNRTKNDHQQRQGAEMRNRFAHCGDKIKFLSNCRVWGLFGPRSLAITTPEGWEMLSAKYLVLATGAYEYVPPFPGWTLPGVMTPGAAQVLIKSAGVLPGKRH